MSTKAFRNYERSYLKGGEKKDPLLTIFEKLEKAFLGPESIVLYPGCHRHVTPSLVFQDITYVDFDKKVQDVYDDEKVNEWIDQHKQYWSETAMRFINSSYEGLHKRIKSKKFDLLISLSAGIVTRDCVPFLKDDGIFLVNDSHSDAKVAFLDPSLKLVAYYDETNEEFKTEESDLENLFLVEPRKKSAKRKLTKITAQQVDEAIEIGSRSKRSFVMRKEPMFYVFRKQQQGVIRVERSNIEQSVC